MNTAATTPTGASEIARLDRSLRRHLAFGLGVVLLTVGGAGGWAATTDLAGAVIATGTLTVEGNAKAVQHPNGGVVADLLIEEGRQVKAGDVLIRLDATVTRANLAAISASLDQIYARQARLAAELDGLDGVVAPEALTARLGAAPAEAAMTHERRLFADRKQARSGQKEQLNEEISQLHEQIDGLEVQQQAKGREIALIERELEGMRKLFQMGLIPLNRVNNLDRDSARIAGERGALLAQSAIACGRIAETRLKLLDIDRTMRAEVAEELRDIANREAELVEREVSARDAISRIDIVAPASGAVHELTVHTVGGVVKPGDTLMQIVPDGELTVEARIAPQDIDQLSLGQPATLRLTAFNRNTTPELEGRVIRLSADLETDQRTGAGYYRAAIAIPISERARLPGLSLMPGMPVEAHMRTGDRTVLSYLTKPIHDHAARVFRED